MKIRIFDRKRLLGQLPILQYHPKLVPGPLLNPKTMNREGIDQFVANEDRLIRADVRKFFHLPNRFAKPLTLSSLQLWIRLHQHLSKPARGGQVIQARSQILSQLPIVGSLFHDGEC